MRSMKSKAYSSLSEWPEGAWVRRIGILGLPADLSVASVAWGHDNCWAQKCLLHATLCLAEG